MYLAYYGLKIEPFRLTPDPRFLHLAEPHRAVLLSLLRGVVYRSGISMAIGPAGTGKTTLLHAAMRVLNDRLFPGGKLMSAFITIPTLTPTEFFEALLDELELPCPSPSKTRRLQVLNSHFMRVQESGGTTLIIVDEAHLLSPELLEEIRLLSNIDTHTQKLVQIVLAGQPELEAVIASPRQVALRQRIANRCKLRELSAGETRAYIAQRMHAAGRKGDIPFTAEATEEIHRRTQGVPRLINLVSDASLRSGFTSKTPTVGPELIQDSAESLGLELIPHVAKPHVMETAAGSTGIAK